MMICFYGKSAHTVHIRGKPTSEGFKILALCDYGYTWTFVPMSCIDSTKTNLWGGDLMGISKTGQSVVHLALQLPFQ
ncbi:hypothetical protein BC936DRAFT_145690 [Jimgerdemannia flammicorona]|uniref:Uncharacterized protein n=1 Tax=Jimgerdemannia flammicorona TaxID=994334 RepID=A0A433D9E8_9FUNG|nr:hypothetical protein BC936DRAFT_145690 [Jimgerdemannia flammicorona]